MFSIGAATAAAAAPVNGSAVAVLIWLARIGVYLGLFAGVGGVFFAAWIGQGEAAGGVIIGALWIGLVQCGGLARVAGP